MTLTDLVGNQPGSLLKKALCEFYTPLAHSESCLENKIQEEKKAYPIPQRMDFTDAPIHEFQQGICCEPERETRRDAARPRDQHYDQKGGEPF